MEKQQPLPITLKEAAFNYHKGDFKAFEMWVETHKRDTGRFTLGDANSSGLIEASDNPESMYVVMPMRL